MLVTQINAQTSKGNNSPVIKGAKAKVEYIKKQVINQKLPANLTPYLAGLIFSNKTITPNQSSINKALSVWFKKYSELKLKIDKISDGNTKKMAEKNLDEGNFSAVEKIIGTKIHYSDLTFTFPKSFGTSGDNSPVIIGDYATVSYVVQQIITYDLPEGLTINLINELKIKSELIDSQNEKLDNINTNLKKKDIIIKDYIKKYQFIESELKKTPSEVYKRAYVFFKEGDYEKTLKELEKQGGSDKATGESNMLKAKILLLKLDHSKIDTILTEADKSFTIGVTLAPSGQNFFEYGKFLVDYIHNYVSAINFLEKADLSIEDNRLKVEIYNYLGLSYYVVDRVKSNNMYFKAIALLDSMETLSDNSLISAKSQIYSNIAFNYSTRDFNAENIKTAISYSQKAIDEISRIPVPSHSDLYKKTAFIRQKGQGHAMLNEISQAVECYNTALLFLKDSYKNDPDSFAIDLSSVYYNLNQVYFYSETPERGIDALKQAISIIEPKISLNSKIFLYAYEQLYTALFAYYAIQNKVPETMEGLNIINEKLKPFVQENPKEFLIHQAWINSDKGYIYGLQNNFIEAEKFLLQAYDYYAQNINMIQFDKQKAADCFYRTNELLLKLGKSEEALAHNKKLLTEIKTASSINRFAYEDFIPQLEQQIGRVYTVTKEKDSAYHHMEKSTALVETKAKQYGSSYLGSYGNYISQYYLTNLYFGDYSLADEKVKRFIKVCDIILDVDYYVKENMQAVIGEVTSNFAVQLFGFAQAGSATTKYSELSKIYDNCSYYFLLSEKYFENGLNNANNRFKYSQTLYKSMILEEFLFKFSQSDSQKALSLEKKCKLSSKSLSNIKDLPDNVSTQSLRNNIKVLSFNCN
ncbi:hypothetical protein DMB65_12240 [Flavobacterium cheongpyeongense]|uniref:Tetratricopeptide repeat protein n=2 Tax=Flavobacterium cheongpyeongense TaxID=2212651 RepID=A0A2V4BRT5_9FLAO|nr:hypothetical protein DMB65_12240 [Flavobacterium cheongpyeongense]